MNNNRPSGSHFEFADFRLYSDERLLTKNDTRIALTPRVFDLLIVLVERESELVTKEALLDLVWPDSFVGEDNISRAVSTLRKNLGVQSNGSDFIETVPKLGYRFIAPVRRVDNRGAETVSSDKIPVRSRSFLFGIAFLIFLAAGLVLYFVLTPPKPRAVAGLINLTNDRGDDLMPSWSTDGSKIAFTSNRAGTADIYVMNADGTGVTRLTHSNGTEIAPVWSPDGTKIVVDSDRDGNREIYSMNADGSNQTRLTFNPTSDCGPVSFSPDGKRIAFARNASNDGQGMDNYDIYTMNIDGSDVRQLTTDPTFDAEPVWSPDGSRILFISGRDRNFEIFAINTDGTGEVNLTNSPAYDGAFAFAADGNHVFFLSNSAEKIELNQVFLMNADGTNRRRITSFSDRISRVAYSAAAGKFAVSSKREGNFEIYGMEAGN